MNTAKRFAWRRSWIIEADSVGLGEIVGRLVDILIRVFGVNCVGEEIVVSWNLEYFGSSRVLVLSMEKH